MDIDADGSRHEEATRRLLGLNAGSYVLLGAGLVLAGRPIGRHMRLRVQFVRTVGTLAGALGVGVGVSSVAEDWVAVTRRVAVVNVVAAAALIGTAAWRGRSPARLTTLAVAAPLAALAYAQGRELVAHQGAVIA